jgi:hypothetical protein
MFYGRPAAKLHAWRPPDVEAAHNVPQRPKHDAKPAASLEVSPARAARIAEPTEIRVEAMEAVQSLERSRGTPRRMGAAYWGYRARGSWRAASAISVTFPGTSIGHEIPVARVPARPDRRTRSRAALAGEPATVPMA